MSTSRDGRKRATVQAVGMIIGDDGFSVCLPDKRRIYVPYRAFHRLEAATAEQRRHFELCGQGRLLHWPEIDEDIEVQHILEGRLPIKSPAQVMVVAETKSKYGKK